MGQNEINDRVARGAALLDERRPGWAGRIELHRLDMSHGHHCVLGQLYGEYARGARILWPGIMGCACCAHEAIAYGFNRGGDMGFGEYSRLTEAWERQITARLSRHASMLMEDGWLLSRDALSVISPATGGYADALQDGHYELPPQRAAEILGAEPTED